ncbi:3-phosphoshikimate 1-carboxyvinyltransferase [Devosia rhodophyticola]|uniref:3-phosphoshikimate 1-carboxyvinyltransferase n=1 Tax=Devosia rhodophyticola TaxID=3026423 RepID=A0ABY7Z0V2_9HYPH|nr:3-phosphoshikimate 1-carboxyvinyltransferase [Devosia rhodophyticola]WDR07162.1 3-phosphoshikimate 1-carboxyvinyltransferase [Devosia rhodophyticola]
MASQPLPPSPITSSRATPLQGLFTISGDSFISHGALILGATAMGQTIIEGLLESPDVLVTAEVLRVFGARVQNHGDHWSVDGLGVGGLLAPVAPIDFAGNAIGAQMVMGLASSYGFVTSLVGDATLSASPMRPILDPLMAIGVEVIEHADYQLPLTLRGPQTCLPLSVRVPIASLTVKSALLLAGLNIAGTTTIIEPEPTRDHLENLLRQFGAAISVQTSETGERTVEMAGLPDLQAQRFKVPGDPSSAAFPLVAGLIVPGSELVIENVLMSVSRTGLIDTLLEMGGNISFFNQRQIGGEDIADLKVRHSNLRGLRVPADRVAAIAGDYPILSIAAAFAEGETIMLGLDQLLAEQSQLLKGVIAGLAANGVEASLGPDSMRVMGGSKKIGGGSVVAHSNYRLAMSFLVMGMAASQPVTIDDETMPDLGFADLFAGFKALGANFSSAG